MTEELAVGTRIRVKPNIAAPDLPDFTIAGWTGTIVELSGKKTNRKYIIEWDAETVDQFPPEYVQQCEAKQLFHLMACLPKQDVEVVEE